MFTLSSTVCEIFTIEMCKTLAETFRTNGLRSNVNMRIERPYVTSYVLAIAIVCHMRHCLRDNYVCTSECSIFEIFTLKMKVKDVDDLNENWQANIACQNEYV